MAAQKRQDLPPGLWVVATPLGNLSDLSTRAREALEIADRVLCEDTRRTGALLQALGITNRLERLDAHAGESALKRQIERLVAGESLALVTDAGTPAISDPGSRLVEAAHLAGHIVTPVPGPSAVAALLSVAGFHESEFAFGGFFPRKPGEREKAIQRASNTGSVPIWVWFESPMRITESLRAVAERAPEASVFVGKEISKLHERFFRGEARAVAQAVSEEIEREGELGEWAFAARFERTGGNRLTGSDSDPDAGWFKALECLHDHGVGATDAAKSVAKRFGVDRKIAYESYLRISGRK